MSKRTFPTAVSSLLCAAALVVTVAYVPSSAAQEEQARFFSRDKTPTSEALWKVIANPRSPYTEWRLMPEINPATGKVIEFPVSVGEQPHGDWVAVYVNGPAFESIAGFDPAKPFTMKDGSILVKENYPGTHEPPDLSPPINQRDGLLSLTVMWKVPGYDFGVPLELVNPQPPNPATSAYLIGGDWFWSMYTGDGSGTLVTLSTQGFITSAANRGKFNLFVGETQSGKPWFCQSCHQGATGVGKAKYRSYGDWVWRLVPFEVSPPPPGSGD